MFSAHGKKKLLLRIQRAKEAGIENPLEYLGIKPGPSNSDSDNGTSPSPPKARSLSTTRGSHSPDSKRKHSSSPGDGTLGYGRGLLEDFDAKRNGKDKFDASGYIVSHNEEEDSIYSEIATMHHLKRLVDNEGMIGKIINRIMDTTARYRPDRDFPVILKAFNCKTLQYEVFKQKLWLTLGLRLSEGEFNVLCEMFDPKGTGIIDGYQFNIVFKKLNMIRQDRHDKKHRETQAELAKLQEEEQLQKTLILEKQLNNDIDFDFGHDDKVHAQRKLIEAAKKFDQGQSSVNLESFSNCIMKPANFRQMIRQLFNLKLSRKELGALLNIMEMPRSIDINCSEFLRQFLAIGIERREKERIAARKKQENYEKKLEQEEVTKLQQKEEHGNFSIDYDFSDLDVARAVAKLTEASTKYDRSLPGCQSLDCFEVHHLGPGAFREALRRTFNLHFTDREMGALVRKYDKENDGHINCGKFITHFLKIGQEERDKKHKHQIEKQRKMIRDAEQEHIQKIKENLESKKFSIDYDFEEADMQSALSKLLVASTKYDKARGATLDSFEPESLTPQLFSEALQRTFNIHLTPAELGALMCTFDKQETGKVHCKTFLNSFMSFGIKERERRHRLQLQSQKENEKKQAEEHEAKVKALEGKVNIDVSFDFTDADRDSALMKLTAAATKYDRSHPAALSLDGFISSEMEAPLFKEMVRRTFGLKLTPTETGALVRHFSRTPLGITVDCPEFIVMFTQLGIAERAHQHKLQLEKQRQEDKMREDEEKRKWNALQGRHEIRIDAGFSPEDQVSAMDKLLAASVAYDKNHPAAPSLSAFECKVMTPGIFRECMKRAFGMRLTPGEVAYLVTLFDATHTNHITCSEFLNRFITMGAAKRYERHTEFLAKERASMKERKALAEAKLKAQHEKSELKVDWSFNQQDLARALEKMTVSAAKFDKSHPAAPSLEGFTVGYLTPGAFRELVKQAFKLHLEPKELAALIKQFPANDEGTTVDPKAFIVAFTKMGCDERARVKAKVLAQQREAEDRQIAQRQRKKKLLEQRSLLALDSNFNEGDRQSAMQKLKAVSAKYDKNAPGCPSLDAFEAKYLLPSEFRDVIRRTFAINFTPKELAAVIDTYKDKKGNLICQDFLIAFMKLGADQRAEDKLIELEKQRIDANHRKTEHARKMREAEAKMVLEINYDFSPEDRTSAFKKLATAAKKYDRSHPGCVALDGFQCLELEPAAFRDIIRRTFHLTFTPEELGAVVQHFDTQGHGNVHCKEFESHFLKVGIAERAKDHSESLRFQREDAKMREKEQADKLAAQWAKHEMAVADEVTDTDRTSALAKLTEAAFKYDAASPGPIGLNAFQTSVMSPAVFREMLRRSFDMKLTDGELAALIEMFALKDNNNNNSFTSGKRRKDIDCNEFITKFIQLGYQKRSQVRAQQLEKQREYSIKLKTEGEIKKKELDEKKEIGAMDESFGKEDFQSALLKIRKIAANYELGHPSAPSLQGFSGGGSMRPGVFKDMIARTFHETLTPKELGSIVKFFDRQGDNTVDLQDFMAHFFTTQREEQNKRRQAEHAAKMEIIQQQRQQEEEKQRLKLINERKRLKFTRDDEDSFLAKIRKAAQTFAVDSHAFAEKLQGFKGPAMFPQAFRDIFYRVFQIRLSFPEMGVLCSILDTSGTLALDGPKFLNWLYKLARREEKILLGEHPDDVTMDSLRINLDLGFQSTGSVSVTRASSTRGRTAATTDGSTNPRTMSTSPDHWTSYSRAQTAVSSTASASASQDRSPSSVRVARQQRRDDSGSPIAASAKPKTSYSGKKKNDLFILPGLLVDGSSSPSARPTDDSSSDQPAPVAEPEIDLSELFQFPTNSPKYRQFRAKTTGLGTKRDAKTNNSDDDGCGKSKTDMSKSMSSIPIATISAAHIGLTSPIKLNPIKTAASTPAPVSELRALAMGQSQAQQRKATTVTKISAAGSQLSSTSEMILNKFAKRKDLLPVNTYFSNSLQSASLVSNLTENSTLDMDHFQSNHSNLDLPSLEALFKDSDIDGGSYLVADKLKKESRLNISALTGSLSKLGHFASKKPPMGPADGVPLGESTESSKVMMSTTKSANPAKKINKEEPHANGHKHNNEDKNKIASDHHSKSGKKKSRKIQDPASSMKKISQGGFLFPGLLAATSVATDTNYDGVDNMSSITAVDIAPVPLITDLF